MFTVVKAGIAGLSMLTTSLATFLDEASEILAEASEMGPGAVAVVACTQRYVSLLDKLRIRADLGPLAVAKIRFYDGDKRVRVKLLGVTRFANYKFGLGCALEIGDSFERNNAEIAYGPYNGEMWPKGSQVGPKNSAVQDVIEDILRIDNNNLRKTRAIVVVKNGEIIAETYSNAADHMRKLFAWSISKSLTSVMIGNLEKRGLVNYTDDNLFPEWSVSGNPRGAITLENMLQFTTGLDLPENYFPGSTVDDMLFTVNDAAAVGLATEMALDSDGTQLVPGTHQAYSTATSILLSKLMMNKLGGTVQANIDNLHENILQKMGMRNINFGTVPSGLFSGGSYLSASARDLARIGQLMLNGGSINGNEIVTSEWVARAIAPNSSENKNDYGYQFWLNTGHTDEETGNWIKKWPALPDNTYSAMGAFGQFSTVFPSQNMVIVRMGWTLPGVFEEYPANENFSRILDVAVN